jgi:hypothetical protein
MAPRLGLTDESRKNERKVGVKFAWRKREGQVELLDNNKDDAPEEPEEKL